MKATITIDAKTFNQFPTLVRNDYGFDIQFNILEDNDTPFDLDNLSVTFKTKRIGDSVTTVSSVCTVLSTTNGTAVYTVQVGDLSTSGVYFAEVQVESTSQIQTAPLGKLYIQDDL